MKISFIIVLAFLMSGCGKSSNNPPQLGPQQEPHKVPITLEKEYLDLLNTHRENLGLRSLLNEREIEKSAFGHSRNMAQKRIPFGHLGHGQRCSTIKKNLRQGYRCGEVVAFGQHNAKEVLKAWLNSPGHRKLLEDPDFTHAGLGVSETKSGRKYWTQIFLEI